MNSSVLSSSLTQRRRTIRTVVIRPLPSRRSSVDLPLIYTGNPAVTAATAINADATDVAITAGSNTYTIPNGTSAAAAIATVSGLSKSDKGRYITLVGAGTDKAATIADGSTFVLEEGCNLTAKDRCINHFPCS